MARRGANAERRAGAPAPTAQRAAERPIPAASAHARAPRLNRLIHGRIRLGIMSALAVNEALSFHDLKKLLDATDGNLSVHARKLEEAGYVACRKFFAGRQPRTEYRITPEGRQALERYLTHVEALIEATRRARNEPT